MKNYSTTIFTDAEQNLDTDHLTEISNSFEDCKNVSIRISEMGPIFIRHLSSHYGDSMSRHQLITISLKDIQNHIKFKVCYEMYYAYDGCCEWGKDKLHIFSIADLKDRNSHIFYVVETPEGILEYVYHGDASVQIGDASVVTYSNDNEIVIYNSGDVESIVQIKRE